MSSIPTKQIDGDVSVSRNVNVGGKATIRGSATVGHNLKVEGWLDAPNIKGPNKGLFKTAALLREAFPNPHDGWWALVSDHSSTAADKDKYLGQVYMASGGAWVAQVNADGSPRLGGNPSVDSSEYMAEVEQLTEDIEGVKVRVKQNEDDIKSLRTSQTTQGNQINNLQTAVETAQSRADKGVADAATAQAGVNAINNKIGAINGIAPLNENGLIPTRFIPGALDDVKEFDGFIATDTPPEPMSLGGDAIVVFNSVTGCFVARTTRLTLPIKYYSNWFGADAFGELSANGRIPASDKLYVDTGENKTYRWSGSQMVNTGNPLALGHTSSTAFPGDEGAQLQTDVEAVEKRARENEVKIYQLDIRPFSGIWDGSSPAPKFGLWYGPSDVYEGEFCFHEFGIDVYEYFGYAMEEYNSDSVGRNDHIYCCEDMLYRIVDGKMMELGGSAVGNTFNATVELPLPQGEYYSDIVSETQTHNVLQAVFNKGVASLGLQITFAIGPTSWKTYQYVGPNITEEQFVNKPNENWIDLAGMSAGDEPIINVNDKCNDIDYTLSTAISAVQELEKTTGIKYLKPGIILTYRTAEKDAKNAPVWEAFQFTRTLADINPADLKPWIPFGGGGGTKLEAKDDPAANGKDAFSTGGAYKYIPTKYAVTQEDGTVSIQPQNDADEPLGDPITFFASQGGGGEVSGTLVNITFENSPLYGAVGKDIIGKACIRSVTQLGAGKEQTNTIVTLRLIDRDTKVTVREWTVNTRSSDEGEYNFEIPFTGMFDGAGQRRFRLEAVDDTDHTGSRNINVTAVDATVESTQVLNYTNDYVIPFNGTKAVNIPLYMFPRNVSEKGIQAFIEVWWQGAWKPLTPTPPTHYDTYSNSAPFNPSNLFGGGEKMQHGAYPVRIHGKDVASGVVGNTIYTAVMCIDPTSSVPVVALRYDDKGDGKVRLYDRISVEVAAYNPKSLETNVEVKRGDTIIKRTTLGQNQVEKVDMQVNGYKNGDQFTIKAEAYKGEEILATSGLINLTVEGSAIDASLMDGALYHFDFSSRSNSEPSHEIKEDIYEVKVNGSNWNSNGFCTYLGQNALRIAENVTAELNHAPFASRTIEATGMAFQMMFATNNIKDENALLLQCIDPESGAGFYLKGNKVGLQCKGGSPALIERRFPCGEIHTFAVVVEPASMSINRNGTEWSTLRLYLDGELVGAIGYTPGGSRLLNSHNIKMNGTEGDLYVYYMLAYQSHYDWSQAFRNYVVKLADTTAMIAEYNRENVLVSQNAEGSTSMRPSAALMYANGMPYCVFVADTETFDIFDFGKGGDDNGTSTSDNFTMTVYYYDPARPWRSFKAVGCRIRRQGTTSAKRPKKNYRIYFDKAKEIVALYPDYDNEDALTTYALFAKKKVRVQTDSIPVNRVTIKVDYSNSGGANDSSVCDMVNATYRALGQEFLTPAQRCYDGTWQDGDVSLTGLQMNHSTANHPIAVFRSDSDTLQNVWFESKGNWKEDKGEQIALGFKDTPGYNLGCLNYQDEAFTEIFGTPGETLDQIEARFKTMENLDTGQLYLLSLYCGRNYRFMKYEGGVWKNSTGSWKWVNGKPVITGNVLNPVGGFELLTYEALDWWRGVSSVEDMMRPSKNIAKWVQKLIDDPKSGVTGSEFPTWTYYFECMVDNDQLAVDLAMGRKVPFELYVQLRFCDWCDYDKHPDEWISRWEEHAWKFRNVKSDMVYLADADYQNEFDSLSKNHQPMHFLLEGHEVVGGVYDPTRTGATSPTGFNCDFVATEQQPIIQQANKKYDIDGAYMSDNDGGDTGQPEADPTKPSDNTSGYVNPWAGWGAVPWRAYFASGALENHSIKTDANGGAAEYKKTVASMRNVQVVLPDGRSLNPFSPDGAKYYFLTQHLEKWQKVVSSYDGIRKYIKYTATSDALYFYALQGLGLAAIAEFIDTRWRFRDGYYKTGGFFTGVLSGRIAVGDNPSIRVVAGKSGYFGMGNDSSGSLSADGAVYLEEGEEYIFKNFSHQQGALLYIYQADRMREIEFTDVSLSENFDFSVMKLAEKIIIGGENYTQHTIGYNPLTLLPLSELPFLRSLDVRNTLMTMVDASKCPRLEELLAGGSQLDTFSVAQTSPLHTLELPGTVTRLDLVNLPRLTYPGGLTIASMEHVSRLMLDGCPHIDPMSLINGIVSSSNIRQIRLPQVNITAPSSILIALKNSGAVGIDQSGAAYEETNKCSGITGRWIMEDLIEDTSTDSNVVSLDKLQAYFPELELHNSQFSLLKINDIISGDFCERYSNPENQTGADYEKKFVSSGHTLKILRGTHAYKCTFNSRLNQMEGRQLSDTDFNYLNNGESFDVADSAGEGFDIFHHFPHYWYKGVNDYKNQVKYILYSTTDAEPLSTVTNKVEAMLSELLYAENTGVYADEAQVGQQIDDTIIATASNTNAYRMDVEGMRQVRWPGMNHARLGAVFTDANGRIVGKFIMSVSHAYFDFSIGNYVFCDVPSGAKYLYFTSFRDIGDIKCLAVDSAHIEAIEPEWTEHKVGDEDSLVGTYPITIDGLKMPRSLSGAVRSRKGDNVSTTSSEWALDAEGNPTETPIGTIHYTAKDFQNSTRRRGAGYQLQDYEQHKEISNLWWALHGTTNEQSVVGNGAHDATLNSRDTIGMADTEYVGNAMNSIMGLKHYVGCDSEWMDYIACNVKSYSEFYKNRCIETADDPVDYKAHIYDPWTKTERVVQCVTSDGNCVVRVVHGAKCDILPSKVHQTDKSKYTTHYAAGFWLPGSKGRVVLRSGNNASPSSGLAYAVASVASSFSYSNSGGRLAFRGKFVIIE